MPGESTISCIKQMMALIKYNTFDATGCSLFFVGCGNTDCLISGCLVQHQSVVGDDNISFAASPHRALNKAALKVRTGGVDTFAASISETQRCWRQVTGLSINRDVLKKHKQP